MPLSIITGGSSISYAKNRSTIEATTLILLGAPNLHGRPTPSTPVNGPADGLTARKKGATSKRLLARGPHTS